MKFLVTGGMGLIGHNVVQRLEHKEHEVVIVDIMTNYGIIPTQTRCDHTHGKFSATESCQR